MKKCKNYYELMDNTTNKNFTNKQNFNVLKRNIKMYFVVNLNSMY